MSHENQTPQTTDITALMLEQDRSRHADLDTYWQSGEFASMVDQESTKQFEKIADAISKFDEDGQQPARLDARSPYLHESFQPSEQVGANPYNQYPYARMQTYDSVRNKLEASFEHTSATPNEVDSHNPQYNTTTKVAWDEAGKAFFIIERNGSPYAKDDSLKYAEHDGDILGGSVMPSLFVARKVSDIKGVVGDSHNYLNDLTALDETEQDKAVSHVAQKLMKSYQNGYRSGLEDLSAEVFDKDKLPQAKVEKAQKPAGKIASRLLKRS